MSYSYDYSDYYDFCFDYYSNAKSSKKFAKTSKHDNRARQAICESLGFGKVKPWKYVPYKYNEVVSDSLLLLLPSVMCSSRLIYANIRVRENHAQQPNTL